MKPPGSNKLSIGEPILSQKSKLLSRQNLLLFVFLALVLIFVTTFLMSVVTGSSMEQTFKNGQLLLVRRRNFLNPNLHRGDVVLIQRERREVIIKRIYKLPGEEIQRGPPYIYEQNKSRLLMDYYDQKAEKTLEGISTRYFVPKGYILVLGDNAQVSEDSRFFGPVAIRDVIGTVAGNTEQVAAPPSNEPPFRPGAP